jgi:hypothetical protein
MDQRKTDMTDVELIGYCDIHCETPRAMFNDVHINRMIELAGFPADFPRTVSRGWYSLHEDMKDLVKLARDRLPKPVLRCVRCNKPESEHGDEGMNCGDYIVPIAPEAIIDDLLALFLYLDDSNEAGKERRATVWRAIRMIKPYKNDHE